MHPHMPRLFTFLTIIIPLFTITVFASAIPSPANTTSIREYSRTLPGIPFEIPDPKYWCPSDCGSSPYQQPCRPCNSASSLNLPLRSLFKLPAILINTAIIGTKKVRAAALPLLTVQEKTDREARFLQPNSLEQRNATMLEERARPWYCNCNAPNMVTGVCFESPSCCWDNSCLPIPANSASGLKVPSVFKLAVVLFNVLGSLPVTLAAAIPFANEGFSSIRSLSPHEQRMDAKMEGRGYPSYCHCDEDGCGDSPACCANGSCYYNHPWYCEDADYAAKTPCCADDSCPETPPAHVGRAASGLTVPSVFKIPVIAWSAISSLPATLAAAIPSPDKGTSSINLLLHERRNTTMLEGRDYPSYCDCNEDGCSAKSPTCCANGSCYYNHPSYCDFGAVAYVVECCADNSCPPQPHLASESPSGFRAPSIFKMPVIIWSAISSLPATFAAVIPSLAEDASSFIPFTDEQRIAARLNGGPAGVNYSERCNCDEKGCYGPDAQCCVSSACPDWYWDRQYYYDQAASATTPKPRVVAKMWVAAVVVGVVCQFAGFI